MYEGKLGINNIFYAGRYCPWFPTTDGEAAKRIRNGVKPLILIERGNQLRIAPTLTVFEEKVLAYLPKE